jgi:predicted DCC family thiol-disulfide oxidoreductase YuxK
MVSAPLILFDGVCNYCNTMVNFIIRRDKKKIFRFAPLQSEAARNILQRFHLPQNNFDSFMLFENNKIYQRSDAALRLYNKLPWYWKWTQVFWIIPKFIRDGVYNVIARNRYKWFGKKDQCMVPAPGVKERFLL